jgi:hypothetical protein
MNYVTDSIEKNSYQDSFSASKKKKKISAFYTTRNFIIVFTTE